MKNFRWILLSGLLVAATSTAQAQAPGSPGGGPSGSPIPASGSSLDSSSSSIGGTGSAADAGAITNTTTTTTTTGVAPDASAEGGFVAADDAAVGDSASESSIPDTGGEPMIAIVAGLSIAGAALAMRRKVTA